MNISVFCASSQPRNPRIAQAAAELGRSLALHGHTLLYGGSNLGLMGTLSGAALEAGGAVVGVIPNFFSEEIIRSQRVTELVRVHSMAERKEYLIAHSDAFIALPGGIGTLDEVSEVLVANQLGHIHKPMGLLDTMGYFSSLMDFLQHMQREGFYNLDGANYLLTDSTPEGLLQKLTSYIPCAAESDIPQRLRRGD